MATIIDVLRNKRIEEYIPELELQSDGTYRGQCPIHGDNTSPAFVVYPDNKFHCFGCNASGDLITFKMLKDNVPFAVAVKALADDFGLEFDETFTKQQSMVERKEREAGFYTKNLPAIYDYLTKSRNLSNGTIKRFQLGYSTTSKCITIPMQDIYGRIISFGYRYFEGSVKYRNGKNTELFEKGKYLYGINFAVERLRKTSTLYICEGFFDMMSADQQGLACVAYCGITLTADHVQLIKSIIGRREIQVVLVPDNDGKADRFVARARDLFRVYAPKIIVEVMEIEQGYKDLNDLHVANKSIADEPITSIEMFLVKHITKQNSLVVQKKRVAELVNTIKDPLIKLDIATYLSNVWQKPLDTIKEFLKVKQETLDEVLSDFADISQCASELISSSENPIHFGYRCIDECIDMYKEQITCIAAASNMGKTDFLLEVLLNAALVQKKNVLFFSLEMSKRDVCKIILAKLLQQPRYKVKDFILNNPMQANNFIEKIGKRLYIVDKVMSFDEIDSYIKIAKTRIFTEGMLDIVAIDHFGLMKNNSTVEQQSQNGDKAIKVAKDNKVCLIMVAQLNKASQTIEKGKIREPMLTDLSGSAALGNACTNVLGIWRPEKTPGLGEIDQEKWKNITRLKILKYREIKEMNLYHQFKYNPETSRLLEE